MLDTLTIARRLTAAGREPTQANAITDAIRTAADSGDTATKAEPRHAPRGPLTAPCCSRRA